jgi:SAM-dependent methyltransferase
MSKGDLVNVYAWRRKSSRLFIKRGEKITQKEANECVYVGSGIAKCGREVFKEYDKLEGVGIEMTQPLLCTISYTDALKPVLFMQNYPSMLVARALDPQGGDSVLDMCASPGGKSSHLAYLLAQRRNTSGFSNSSGKLVSIDVKANKCKKIRELLDRYSLEAQVHCLDSMKLLQIQKDQLSKNTIQFELESFDKILLDPPCSGIGQRPCLEYDFPDASSDGICKIQKQLFSVACRLLKPGGVILYSTCTVNPLENEVVTKFALDNFDLDLLDIRNFFGLTENCTEEESIAKGFGRFGIRTSVSGDMILSEDDARKVLRFDHEAMKDIPASFDSVFFYVAGFRKPTVS